MTNELTGVQRSLTSLEVQVSHLNETNKRVVNALDKLTAIEAQNATRDARIGDHETRLRSLEVNAWKVAGVLAFVSFVGPAVILKVLGAF